MRPFPDHWTFELKIGKPVTPALANVHIDFVFLRFFVYHA